VVVYPGRFKDGTAKAETLTESVLQMIHEIIRADYPKIDLSVLPEQYKRTGASGRSLVSVPDARNPLLKERTGMVVPAGGKAASLLFGNIPSVQC